MSATPIHQSFVASALCAALAEAATRAVPARRVRRRFILVDGRSGSRVDGRPSTRDSLTAQGGPCDSSLPHGFDVVGHNLLAQPRRRDRCAAGRARRP